MIVCDFRCCQASRICVLFMSKLLPRMVFSMKTMVDMRVNVLLITDNASDAAMIRDLLADCFKLEWVRTLAGACERLKRPEVGAILLDLFLPDSRGMETFNRLSAAHPQIPFLIFSGLDQDDAVSHTMARAPYDYLPKAHLDRFLLSQSLHNVIGRKAVEETLFAERERAEVTLNSIADAVLSTDINGRVTYMNKVAEHMTGWPREQGIGKPLEEVLQLVDAVTRQAIPNPMKTAILNNTVSGLTPNSILIRRDGVEAAVEDSAAPIRDRNGKVVGAVMVFHDVTEAREMALRMAYSANYDFLTDLPNRTLLYDRIEQAIELAKRDEHKLALLFLDLDHLKHINDSLGHAIGDKLLQSVALRLVECVRSSDTVSRQGGDEFVILLSRIAHIDDGAECAKKMLAALEVPHTIGNHDLHISASIGISMYPGDGQDAETLMQSADIAMYQAKKRGRNNYQCFKPEMNARAVERQFIEASLRQALRRKEFVLHYQPKVNLATGAISGVEALIRWMHPERGLMAPADFIPIAEECGVIVNIGRWVMRQACMQAQIWRNAGFAPTPVAVNISAIEFRDRDFLDSVSSILRESGLPARYLELELTESVLMEDAGSATFVLHALKTMGVQFAIDDFGTGYSSLSYLKRFPIDALKIDQSFVQDIATDKDAATIVNAVIGMGKNLKQRVVAEGVETQIQLRFLQAQRCIEGQGYYFGRPMSADEFAIVLEGGLSDVVLD